ncbi:MAG: hypothetical protein OSB19_15435 [Opitutaceae bacterium]|nr:hypothetical protein [Opitutaceae bacterium]
MVFLQNPPDYSRLVDESAWEKTYEEEKKRRRKEEPVLDFASNLSKNVRRNLRKRERIEKVAYKTFSSASLVRFSLSRSRELLHSEYADTYDRDVGVEVVEDEFLRSATDK